MRAVGMAWLLVVACPSVARAAPVTLVTRLSGEHAASASAPPKLLTLQFTPETGDGAPLRFQVPLPGRADVELPAGARWRVELEDDAFWTRALVVSTEEAGARPLDVFPAGVVEGKVL